MNRNHLMIAGALLGATFSASMANAQSSSLFGGRGVTGSSGTMSNGVGGGQSAYGNSGSLTGFTGTTAGSAAGFASGAPVNNSLAGQGTGTFAGNRNSANAASQNGQAAQGGAAGRGGAANRGGAAGGRSSLGGMSGGGNSQQNRGNSNRGGNNSSQSTSIRPMQRIAFDFTPRTSNTVEASLGSQVAALTAQGKLVGNVTVQAGENGRVTLTGEVASESERRKAELSAKLEPGVRSVVNELTVAPPQ